MTRTVAESRGIPGGQLSPFVAAYVNRLKYTIDALPDQRIEAIGEVLLGAYTHQKQVFIIGNGGSAATASHIACDLGKNTVSPNRPRFRILSLCDNIALISALSNDVGYDRVFSEQLENLIRRGDVLVAISASGNSPNIIRAMHYARDRGATTVALLGFDGGQAIRLADEHVLAPSNDYGVIEDVHMIIGHILTSYFMARIDGGRAPSQ